MTYFNSLHVSTPVNRFAHASDAVIFISIQIQSKLMTEGNNLPRIVKYSPTSGPNGNFDKVPTMHTVEKKVKNNQSDERSSGCS